MALLDLLLGLLIAASGLMGLRSGLIHESATLVGLILGLLAGGRYNERLGVFLVPWLHTRGAANLAAFLLILFGTWALVLILGAFLREMLRGLHLGWLDYLGGLILGLAKGLFVAEVVVLILVALPVESVRASVMRSWIGGSMARLAPDLLDLVPPVLRYWKPF